jgi:RHS repeat-associated protein
VLGGTIPNGVGHLTSLTGSGVTCQYGYDVVGRQTNKTCGVDGVARNEGTSYDIGGRVRSMVYRVAGTQVASVGTSQWTYDGAGRLLIIPGVQAGATYTADGQIATQSRPNGVTTTNTYQASRLWLMGIRTTNTTGTTQYQNLTFTRDLRGRILTSTSDVVAESWSYGYDDFDRLTLANNTGGPLDQSFAYNAIGNMTYNSALGNYTYPAPGQPHPHAVTQYGTTSLAYDANGNRTLGGGVAAAYDGENWLVQFATSSFVYGPDGARLKKTVGSTTTLYMGDDWEVNGGVNTFYLPGDAVMTGGVISWLHRDQLGSVRLTTNAAGAIVQRAHYKPYGQRLETIATVMTSKGFIGERDDETGLVYLHARYLNPVLGRFITPYPSPDPTQPGVGLNRYAYAGDSPIVNLDTSGLFYAPPATMVMGESAPLSPRERAILSLPGDLAEIYGGALLTGETGGLGALFGGATLMAHGQMHWNADIEQIMTNQPTDTLLARGIVATTGVSPNIARVVDDLSVPGGLAFIRAGRLAVAAVREVALSTEVPNFEKVIPVSLSVGSERS